MQILKKMYTKKRNIQGVTFSILYNESCKKLNRSNLQKLCFRGMAYDLPDGQGITIRSEVPFLRNSFPTIFLTARFLVSPVIIL